ncbi:ubiquinol oxidase subunit II [Hephaestia sp. GCM10023244]|uniref:ubiquinol oxidase subunit II n=1 Tax=unclassified Hephaestia TaxID=2631281 RepID=UPI002076D7A5|nr:ubiquinol oxidase subunit II [Hephaestia sp. MAHUQ-44]MCM8732025.1 ubiquinol oxidase subunit II [Hephaestia sp. MAHUQ-44]
MIRICAIARRLESCAKALTITGVSALLAGCSAVVLAPAGDVAAQQRDLLVISVVLMLLIIIPVMVLIVWFAWRYRESNKEATYAPDWDHSTKLELVIWAVPLLIIICLGAVTWLGTHMLDPYRPISRIASDRAVNPAVKPLEVEVVALDWKWLFLYPEYGVATVNDMAAPVDRPIVFKITASSVMNSFYIPALAGQIYAMPGMETKLHAVINAPGVYDGFSANYSGAGFSGMRFKFHGLSGGGFDRWIAEARASDRTLDSATYLDLLKPSENVPVTRFADVEPGLYTAALNMCVAPGAPCMNDIMAKDMRAAAGHVTADHHAPPPTVRFSAPALSTTQPIAGAGLVPPAEQARIARSAKALSAQDRQPL